MAGCGSGGNRCAVGSTTQRGTTVNEINLRPVWPIRLLDAVSQFLNVLLLNGDANESISGRAYRENWKAEKFIDTLFFFDPEHCRNAYLSDLARAYALTNS